MKKGTQRAMHCRCGNSKILAVGLCGTCYTLKRQDEEYFGGLREAVLERDGYRCRVCDASGRDKRSIIVHHRKPGRSVLNLMVSLCPGCHAKVHRTKAVLSAMPPLLLELWREQHPKGHEQCSSTSPRRNRQPSSFLCSERKGNERSRCRVLRAQVPTTAFSGTNEAGKSCLFPEESSALLH